MAPAGGKSAGKTNVTRRKDKPSVALDGLIADLFQRVQKPLDLVEAQHTDHLGAIRHIHRLLLQIQKHERGVSTSPAPLDGPSRMRALSKFLSQHEVEMKRLRLEDRLQEGGGVVATESISQGEIFASVPSDVMMTTLTAMKAKDDVGLVATHDPWLRAVPSLILAMHLLFEKHRPESAPSKWRGYIQSLPGQRSAQDTNVDGPDQIMLPLAFSMETVEALKGTSALGEYHKLVASVAKQYCHMRIALRQLAPASTSIQRSLSWFNFVQFRWAVSMVMMRQNQVPMAVEGGGIEHTMALVPLMDMFNHEEGPLTSHFDFGSHRMEISAKRDFEAGDQVYMSYGTRPNILYLLYAGFLPSKNSVDRIRLAVDLSPSDPLHTKKLGLLRWLEVKPRALLDLFWDGSPSPDLAKWLKVAAMDDDVILMKKMREAIASRAEATALLLQEKANREERGEEGKEKKETERYVEAVKSLVGSVKEGGGEGKGEGGGEEREKGEMEKREGQGDEKGEGKDEEEHREKKKMEKREREEEIGGVSSDSVSNGHGSGEGDLVGVGLTVYEAKVLVGLCEVKLKEIEEGESDSVNTGVSPVGLGLGISRVTEDDSVNRALKKERELVMRLKEGERNTLKAAISRWKPEQV